jgi:predicted nucleotidyltransferase component of viral defense system
MGKQPTRARLAPPAEVRITVITFDEIDERAADLDIHISDVERDYVFGWLLCGLYQASALSSVLTLKGGNALRKGYFSATRFSDDLDFTTVRGVDPDFLMDELNRVCAFAQKQTGVQFDLDRNRIAGEHFIDRRKRVYKARLYFRDFSGIANQITLKVRVDVSEYDRLYLPVQVRRLIHPYSDAKLCGTEIRCVALEEALADKLKCLLQRRYAYDLFDLVYGISINQEQAVDRLELVRVFLRKSIFERSPIAAKNLLLALPLDRLRDFWGRLLCPVNSRISFNQAASALKHGIETLFAPFEYGSELLPAFFPAEFRNPIMQAGSERKLLRLTYHGIPRQVEPYSLVFKRRRDGVAQEYFYVYDRTGGLTSGPGIKALLQGDIQSIDVTDEPFEPRWVVELAKAGDRTSATYFKGRGTGVRAPRSMARPSAGLGSTVYVIECPQCRRRFRRTRPSTRLNPHNDNYGNPCNGRSGIRLF